MTSQAPLPRPIAPTDNPAMANIIRTVMAEFGAMGPGYSSSDPEVDTMYEAYRDSRSAYFVVEINGEIVAGSGVAPLEGGPDSVCELRKMYALASARGSGVGRLLMDESLAAARRIGFEICYLETLSNMDRARSLYRSYGFEQIAAPMGKTGHGGCDNWYTLML